jgi:FHS family Na+ dependent glucose MFS transporter 1
MADRTPGVTASAPAAGETRPLLAAEAVCWLAYGAIGLSGGLLGPALPALRHYLHAGYGELGLLFAASSVGGTVASLFGNRLLDGLGYRRLLTASAVVLGLASILRADLAFLPVWVILGAVGGFAAVGVDIGGIRYVAAAATSARRNAALNLLNVFYSVGSVASPLIVAALAATGASVLWAYTLTGFMLVLTALAARATVPQGRPEAGEVNALAAWRWALGRPAIVRLALVIALYAALEQAFGGWIASYAQSRDHLSLAAAAAFPLVFWAAMTVGRAVSAERARHWSEGTLLAVGALTVTVGAALAIFTRDPLAIGAAAALSGIGCGPIWPSVFSLAAHRAPDRHSEAYGLLYPAASVGVLVAPWLAGELFGALGPRAALAVPLACALLMSALLAHVARTDGLAPEGVAAASG